MELSVKKTMLELNRLPNEQYAAVHTNGLVLILDNVRSAFNVGSIFRTGDGFGVSHVYLCGITCQTGNRELQKTALGAEISVPSTYSESTLEVIERLKQEYFIILALEQTKDSHSLANYTFTPQGKYALVLGNEVEGVSEEVLKTCDDCIEIPQIGSKHSLNVANATSIVLWEFYKSRENANTI